MRVFEGSDGIVLYPEYCGVTQINTRDQISQNHTPFLLPKVMSKHWQKPNWNVVNAAVPM
jgi:hypothetical protein